MQSVYECVAGSNQGSSHELSYIARTHHTPLCCQASWRAVVAARKMRSTRALQLEVERQVRLCNCLVVAHLSYLATVLYLHATWFLLA